MAIRITYYEGEYTPNELICATGQSKLYGLAMTEKLNHGHRTFDAVQFAALIEKYRGIYEQEVESSDTEESTSDTEETVSDTTDTSLS